MIKIALADEHFIFLEGLAATLNSFPDCEVIIKATDGAELLQQFEKGLLPEICIFDISLPVTNGYETLKEIKKRWPSMKVLILSMFTNEMSIIRTVKVGANGFMLKSCEPADLHQALVSIHTKGHYYSQLVPETHFAQARESLLLKLNYREMEFISLCCTELTYKAIAEKMRVSMRTVDGYRSTLYEKLSVNTRIGLVLFALNMGMVPIYNK
jgi:two-component system invasion response regulator UvrY